MLSKGIRRSWRASARTLAAAVFLIGGAGAANEIYAQETIARRNTDEGTKSAAPSTPLNSRKEMPMYSIDSLARAGLVIL